MWTKEWTRLSRRIETWLAGAEAMKLNPTDYYGMSEATLLPDAGAIENELEKMVNTFKGSAPELSVIFSGRHPARVKLKHGSSPPVGAGGVQAWAMYLATIRGQIDHLAQDPEADYSARVERAVQHAQRLVVVDSDVNGKWAAAYADGETACERLGAVHLLWHGVWAFKANASGERTDLITNSILGNDQIDDAARGGSVLTLTEWKRVTAQLTVSQAAEQAKTQLKRYSGGSLAATELRRTCYAILVSVLHETMPADADLGQGMRVRFVNLAVDPLPPSRS
jgi:hypothetical protein